MDGFQKNILFPIIVTVVGGFLVKLAWEEYRTEQPRVVIYEEPRITIEEQANFYQTPHPGSQTTTRRGKTDDDEEDDDEPELSEAERRAIEFKEFINGGGSTNSIAFLFRDAQVSSGRSQFPGVFLQNLKKLNSSHSLNSNFFSSRLLTSEYFDELLLGDNQLLLDTGALKNTNGLIVAEMQFAGCGNRSSLNRRLISCDLEVSYVTYGRGGNVTKQDILTEVGAAFSETEAQKRAVELMVERQGSAMLPM